jgi:hypothetical protein
LRRLPSSPRHDVTRHLGSYEKTGEFGDLLEAMRGLVTEVEAAASEVSPWVAGPVACRCADAIVMLVQVSEPFTPTNSLRSTTPNFSAVGFCWRDVQEPVLRYPLVLSEYRIATAPRRRSSS